MIKAPLSVTDLLSRHDAVIPYFNKLWTSGEENELYKKGQHWTDAQKTSIEKQNRVAYAISMTATKVNQVLSYQRNNRSEFKLRALVDPNDEVKASVGNIIFKDAEARNNFKYLEADTFDSGVSIKYGVVGIGVEKDYDYRDVVKLRHIDYKNFVWDSNAVSYTKEDALFMAELSKIYRYQVEEEYGKDASKRVAMNDSSLWGRIKNVSYYISPNMDERYDLLTKFTHYEKVLRDYWIVVFNDYTNLNGLNGDQIALKTRNKKEAEKKLRELEFEYLIRGLPLGTGEVIKESKVELDKYVFTVDGILEYEETDMEMFPYGIYQAYHFEDNLWSLTDLLKSMQKFIDRYIAQIDYSFGKDIKNVYEMAVNQLADGITYEKALTILEDSGILPVKMTGAINAVRGQGINPQWIQMVQTMQGFLEDLAGGRSFQGLSEGANESGRSVLAKTQQGELIASLFLDNLKRWKKDLGDKMLWFFKKYDTSERVIKIGGGELTPEMLQLLQSEGVYIPSKAEQDSGYLKINSHPLTFLKDAECELIVTESPLSETRRQQKFAQLAILPQINPMIAQTPEYMQLLLENADIEYDVRKRLITGLQQQIQAQQQMVQAQQQATQEATQKGIALEASKAILSHQEKMAAINKADKK